MLFCQCKTVFLCDSLSHKWSKLIQSVKGLRKFKKLNLNDSYLINPFLPFTHRESDFMRNLSFGFQFGLVQDI